MTRKPSTLPRLALAVLVLAAATLTGCLSATDNPDLSTGSGEPAPAPKPRITIAIQPTENAAAIQSKAETLEKFLEARVDADIRIVVPLTYMGVVEALRFEHADVALMSAWPAVVASQKANADVVLAEKREVIIGDKPSVEPFYFSYYVVKKDSPYETLEDLRGKTVAYPSTSSTSGYVFPVAKLVEKGLVARPAPGMEANAKEHFGNVLFTGGYAQGWEALKNGQADVAVIAGDVKADLYNDVLANTRIVETQGPVPSHAVVFSKDLQGPVREDLLEAFLELKGENQELMRKFVSAIFVEFTPTTTEQHAAKLAGALADVGFRFSEKI